MNGMKILNMSKKVGMLYLYSKKYSNHYVTRANKLHFLTNPSSINSFTVKKWFLKWKRLKNIEKGIIKIRRFVNKSWHIQKGFLQIHKFSWNKLREKEKIIWKYYKQRVMVKVLYRIKLQVVENEIPELEKAEKDHESIHKW